MSQDSAQSLFGTLPKPHVGLASWAGPLAQLENPVSSFLLREWLQSDPPYLLALQDAAVQTPGVSAHGVDSPAVSGCCGLGLPYCLLSTCRNGGQGYGGQCAAARQGEGGGAGEQGHP